MFAPLALAALIAGYSLHGTAAPADAADQQPAAEKPVAQTEPWPPAGVTRVGKDIVAPVIIDETMPRYTRAAMRARIEGSVTMEVVIQRDGKVGEVRVVRSLDRQYGLDEEAVKAVKQWNFKPGTKAGVAVPVLVEIEMTFKVR